jgi:hypothetical protein
VRYKVGHRYLERGDRQWWEYLVLDTFVNDEIGVGHKILCVCSEEKDAQAICDALERYT